MEEDVVVQRIKMLLRQMGSQKLVADKLDISQSYLSDILAGKRVVSESVAKKLGFIRTYTYLRTDGIFTGKGDEIGAILEKRNAIRRSTPSEE